MAGAAWAQKLSVAPDAFLKDVNSLAGVSRTGSVLLAADPNKKSRWADYCSASQGLARSGEFRQAIRTGAKALYLGESANGNYGATVIWASNDIATAYSYAGDRLNATIWADKTLAAISKGFESGVRQEGMVIAREAGWNGRNPVLDGRPVHYTKVQYVNQVFTKLGDSVAMVYVFI